MDTSSLIHLHHPLITLNLEIKGMSCLLFSCIQLFDFASALFFTLLIVLCTSTLVNIAFQ